MILTGEKNTPENNTLKRDQRVGEVEANISKIDLKGEIVKLTGRPNEKLEILYLIDYLEPEESNEELIIETFEDIIEEGIKKYTDLIKKVEERNPEGNYNNSDKFYRELYNKVLNKYKGAQKEDPIEWFKRQKALIVEAKRKSHEYLENMAPQIIELFSDQINEQDIKNISEKMIVAIPREFEEFREIEFPAPYFDPLFTMNIMGFVSGLKKSADERYPVTQLDIKLESTTKPKLYLNVDNMVNKRNIIHESLHCLADKNPREIPNNITKGTIQIRGFHAFTFNYLNELSNNDPVEDRNLNLYLALDEATVSLLTDYLLKEGNMDELDLIYSNNILYSKYDKAKAEMFKIAKKIGIKKITDTYINSNPDGLLTIIKEELGEDYLKNFKNGMISEAMEMR
jgi:hypothetical protein